MGNHYNLPLTSVPRVLISALFPGYDVVWQKKLVNLIELIVDNSAFYTLLLSTYFGGLLILEIFESMTPFV